MKIFLRLIFLFPLLFNSNLYSQIDTGNVINYMLNYSVPESPAFTVLGVNPNKVVSGNNAKPLVLNLLGQFAFGEKISPGFAVDVSPTVFGILPENRKQYQDNYLIRLLVNSSVSLAAVKDKKDSVSSKFGVGFRFTLFDDTDILMDDESCNIIQNALAQYSQNIQNNDTIKNPNIINDAVYKVKSRLQEKTGTALSVGYGFDGILKSSILAADSMKINSHSLWIAGTTSFKSFNLLYTFQGRYGNNISPYNLIGAAISTKRNDINLSCEALYNFKAKKFEGAIIGYVNVVNNLNLTIGIVLDNEFIDESYKTKLNIVSNVSFNLGK